jgi:hypothetical protein
MPRKNPPSLNSRILDRRAVGSVLAAWLFLSSLVSIKSVSAAEAFAENQKAFFVRDVFQFVGRPYRSPDFSEIRIVSQAFESRCDHLNRIILPFYLEGKPQGELLFSLYRAGKAEEPVFSDTVDPGKWPPPSQLGTHRLDGIFHHIWIPPLQNSKNKTYRWELRTQTGEDFRGLGIYLANRFNPRLNFVEIDGMARESAYAAFYSFCQYRFHWDEILSSTRQRLWREKYFLGTYLVLMAGVIAAIGRGRSPR